MVRYHTWVGEAQSEEARQRTEFFVLGPWSCGLLSRVSRQSSTTFFKILSQRDDRKRYKLVLEDK